jgi:hypothetical protein
MPRLFVVVFLLAVASSISVAEEWGDLSLRIVYDGPPPKPAKIAAAGAPFCAGLPLVDDALLVNAKDGGIANFYVYLFEDDASKVPVHPSYAKGAKDEVKMANKGCAFEPKAIALRTTQTFIGENPDPVGHNMKFSPFANTEFNLAIASGGKIAMLFPIVESAPAPMQCNSHPWMKGHVLVRDDPYFAVSDASGKVTIKDLPADEWSFRIWHEKAGFVRKGTLAGKAFEWQRGRMPPLEIKAGKNVLGELLLKPEAFKTP